MLWEQRNIYFTEMKPAQLRKVGNLAGAAWWAQAERVLEGGRQSIPALGSGWGVLPWSQDKDGRETGGDCSQQVHD